MMDAVVTDFQFQKVQFRGVFAALLISVGSNFQFQKVQFRVADRKPSALSAILSIPEGPIQRIFTLTKGDSIPGFQFQKVQFREPSKVEQNPAIPSL